MSVDSAAATPAAGRPADFSTAYKIYALTLLVLVYVSNYGNRVLMSILMPSVQKEFAINDLQLGLLGGTMFAIFYATLGIPIAIYADRGNRKMVIVAATALWSLMTALCGTAQNFWQLAVMRVGVGVGEAGSGPSSHSIIADLFSLK